MSGIRPTSYLRSHRLKAAFTLCELAGLLGVSTTAIWNYEAGCRDIPADVLVASEAIFGASAARIFPHLYNSVAEDLMLRAQELRETLAGRGDPASLKKLALLGGIEDRLQ
jgi:transcriptional regulator with XRE-family HTH domain